jgi:hypothetical protein
VRPAAEIIKGRIDARLRATDAHDVSDTTSSAVSQ